MSGHDLKGIIPPVVTLINKDHSIDKKGMTEHINDLISSGVNGLFFMGTGGEFAHMSMKTRKEVTELAVKVVGGRVPVLIGTGTAGLEETKELSVHAEESGADGLVIINPYYSYVEETHLFAYFETLSKETNLPIILYNFPGTTGQDLNPDFVARLAEKIPSIIGVKETVDEAGHIREMIIKTKAVRPEFKVFSGYDDHLLNTLTLGGDGAISVGVNFAPELQVGIYKAYQDKKFEEAIILHRRLAYIPLLYKLDTPFINIVKETMIMLGKQIQPDVFPPGSAVTEQQRVQIKEILKQAGLQPVSLKK